MAENNGADDGGAVVVPSPEAFAVTLVVGVIAVAVLFVAMGFAAPPYTGTAQQAAAYYAVRLVPIGLALTLFGFVVAVASVIATGLGKVAPKKDLKGVPTAGLSVGDVTDLIKAASGLVSSPAGIGVLVLLLGIALLIGSGFAAPVAPAP